MCSAGTDTETEPINPFFSARVRHALYPTICRWHCDTALGVACISAVGPLSEAPLRSLKISPFLQPYERSVPLHHAPPPRSLKAAHTNRRSSLACPSFLTIVAP